VEPVLFDLECVQKREDHAQLIMQWRNDPDTLKASFDSTPKQWPNFYAEFKEQYFTWQDLPPLFARIGHERVAFIRFRRVKHPSLNAICPEISLNIAPHFRGQGLAAPLLEAIERFLKERGYSFIYAEIKEENISSQKAFLKAGYKQVGRSYKEEAFIGEYVREIHLPPKSAVFIIAEAGSNWRMGHLKRDREMAKALIRVAVDAGADAVKFQTYRPETVYVANAGSSSYLEQQGKNEAMQEMFQDLAMPYELIPELAEYCQSQKIAFMSTAFSPQDFAAVDPFVSVHKIASYEISHLRLLELAAKSGKPLILSTGASREEDIAWAVDYFREKGGRDLTLLQCTAKYPADSRSMNLQVIPWLKRRFSVYAGLSDHSRHPVYAPLSAVALGASCIEKHYTLHNDLPGPDHSFALTPQELKEMVAAIREGEKMLGSGFKEVLDAEQELAQFARRGLQATQDIGKGEVLLEEENFAILRPGGQTLGVHPKWLGELQGKRASRSLKAGEGIQPGDWV
jgi:N-acetylneuraminate synthase